MPVRTNLFTLRFFAHAFFLVFLFALTIRVTFQDALPFPLPLVFYLTPLPVLATLALPEFLYRLAALHRIRGVITGLCVILPLCQWFGSSYRNLSHPDGTRDEESIRILFWTTDNFDSLPIHKAAPVLAEFDADLIILNEGIIDLGTQKSVFPAHFPNHKIAFLPSGRFALIRGSILAENFAASEWQDGTLVQLVVACRGRSFLALLFDHSSDPDLSRKHALKKLDEAIDHFAGRPLILMGDFNLPVDSAYLSHIRANLTNAFDVSGSGFQETWPVPIPLLTLDQVWLGDHMIASRTYHRRMGKSSHEAVIVDLKVDRQASLKGLDFPAP